jgi:curli biogenesis system outer membrane secretion channel CsgG
MDLLSPARLFQRALLAGLLLLTFTLGVYAQNERLGAIAVLPFTGDIRNPITGEKSMDEQNGVPERIAFTPAMRENFRVLLRTDIARETEWEQFFQRQSGMINADDAATLGKNSGAEYVMTGSITALGHQKLLIVSIINLHDIRQVAGDFLKYNSINDLINNPSILNNMTANLVRMARNLKEDLPPLAVMPVRIENDAGESELKGRTVSVPSVAAGDAMAQLLAIYLLRAGVWAVCPRTNLEMLQEEYAKQQQSGTTRTDEAAQAGDAIIPQYVLAVVSRTYESENTFNGMITNLENGSLENGASAPYVLLDDGIIVMEGLARELSGETGAIGTTIINVDTNNFLKNFGIGFHGWGGWGGGSSGGISSGGAGFEMRFYNRVGIQTGLTAIAETALYTPQDGDEQSAQLTALQAPILLRLTFGMERHRGDTWGGLTVFGGVGLNLFTSETDTVVADPGMVNVILGGGLEYSGYHFSLFLGYQYNGGIGGGSLTAGGVSYDYTRAWHMFTLGLTWYIPFRDFE